MGVSAVFALVLTLMLLLSGAGAPEKSQPPQVYALQPASQQERSAESGWLPLP